MSRFLPVRLGWETLRSSVPVGTRTVGCGNEAGQGHISAARPPGTDTSPRLWGWKQRAIVPASISARIRLLWPQYSLSLCEKNTVAERNYRAEARHRVGSSPAPDTSTHCGEGSVTGFHVGRWVPNPSRPHRTLRPVLLPGHPVNRFGAHLTALIYRDDSGLPQADGCVL